MKSGRILFKVFLILAIIIAVAFFTMSIFALIRNDGDNEVVDIIDFSFFGVSLLFLLISFLFKRKKEDK